MPAVITSLALALRQLADPRILAILGKSAGVTLALFLILGWLGYHGLERLLAFAGLNDNVFGWAAETREIASLVLTIVGAWLLWRIIALAVIQFFADDVVRAVEETHYPGQAARARRLAFSEELSAGMRGAMRALMFNLVALPFALALLITGIGTALLFWFVNAALLGRELQDMVWLRHQRGKDDLSPARPWERFVLGGAIAALFLLPFVHFLAPVLGAAAATHLIHRKKEC